MSYAPSGAYIPPVAAAPAGSKGPFNFLYALALCGFLAIAFSQGWTDIDEHMGEIFLFTLNGVLSIVGQVQAINRRASIHYVSFVFCYLFMGVTPLIQLGQGDDPVFLMNAVMMRSAFMAIGFTGIGLYFMRRMSPSAIFSPQDRPVIKAGDAGLLPLFILTSAVTIFTLALYNRALFTNREDFELTQIGIFGDQQTALIFSSFFGSTPFYGATIGLRAAIESRRVNWILLFSLVLLGAAVIENPMVTARFVLAGYAFFFIDYMSRGNGMKMLAVLLMTGVMLAPTFQAFRYETSTSAESSNDYANPFSDTFLSYDYDAFQTMSYTFVNVDEGEITWGKNILGAALFFVPRAVWPDKPEQTSHYIYDTMMKYRFIGTNNLSTALFAEGYYAFWWFGAALISWLYWKAVTVLTDRSARDPNSLGFAFRSVFTGLTLIFLRGTLMVGVAAVCGSFIGILLPWLASSFAKTPKARS